MSSPLLSQLKEPSITPPLLHQYHHTTPFCWEPVTQKQLKKQNLLYNKANKVASEINIILELYLKYIANYSL